MNKIWFVLNKVFLYLNPIMSFIKGFYRNHKAKQPISQPVLVWIRLNGDFKQTHKQPLCSNLWTSDMTCWKQLIHWESSKCLLMSPSDSPQLCCWMLKKTWSNSITLSGCPITALLFPAQPEDHFVMSSKMVLSQMLIIIVHRGYLRVRYWSRSLRSPSLPRKLCWKY